MQIWNTHIWKQYIKILTFSVIKILSIIIWFYIYFYMTIVFQGARVELSESLGMHPLYNVSMVVSHECIWCKSPFFHFLYEIFGKIYIA